MIQIEEIKLENFRGVRELTLPMHRKSFAVQGPNATGKSCVVDGIEFGLTGNVSRLSGEDTKDLSVSNHAAHVDSKAKPESAKVTLRLYLTESKQTFTIVRSVKKPSQPIVKPDTPEVRAALASFSKRDEITLTRRQIVKYILTQPTKRGERVQQLLRLDELGKIRRAMGTALTKCKASVKTAQTELTSAEANVKRHFDISTLDPAAMLTIVNERRKQLGLSVLPSLDERPALETCSESSERGIVRATAIRDLAAFRELAVASDFAEAAGTIESLLSQLDHDPQLNQSLRSQELYKLGLDLVEDDACPLCDSPRPLLELREHFENKLKQSERAAKIAEELAAAIETVIRAGQSQLSAGRTLWKIANAISLESVAENLKLWATQLQGRIDLLGQGLDATRALRAELPSMLGHAELETGIAALDKAVTLMPDQSATIEAAKFLADVDTRVAELKQRRHALTVANTVLGNASFAHETYCRVSTTELESLYQAVEKTFSDAYRSLHSDDENAFVARFRASEGKLDLDVEFHGRGMFPPGAYHSEGHQDSMGLCLYLALMKQVFGDELQLVVLDDVVMSVDSGHRREICRLLKESFPETQFIITTHEEAWFHQMQSTGLIDRKNARMFQSWTPEHGPQVSDNVEAWSKIDEYLDRNDVSAASAALRRHLEFVLPDIAEAIAAKVVFNKSGRMEAGPLLDGCHPRLADLLGKAVKSAEGWLDNDARLAATERLERLRECVAEVGREGRYVNAAIHYNEWATLVKQDFIPVVNAYKQLLLCFQCDRCGSHLRLADQETLRCDCSKTQFNLRKPQPNQKTSLPARLPITFADKVND